MASPVVELGDAIVTDINATARNWSMYFRAERVWKPLWIGKEQLSDLQCLIAPWPIAEIEQRDRTSSQETYSIDFGFAKRLDAKTRSEMDDLQLLIDTVLQRYLKQVFVVANVGQFIPLQRVDEYVMWDPMQASVSRDDTHTYYSGDFLSLFRIPYRFLRT